MADSYADYQVLRSPTWLQDADGAAWERAFGGIKDTIQDRIRLGVLSRFPDFAATDAQNAIGDDRKLPRAPGETNEQYAIRLKAAWDSWKIAGSHTGMLRALKIQGFPGAIIVQDNGRYALLDGNDDAVFGLLNYSPLKDRPGWRFGDFRNDFFSRFMVIFPGPLPGSLLVTARATFADGTDTAQAVWSTPWDSTDYHVAVTQAVFHPTFVALEQARPAVDGTTITKDGCTVRLSQAVATGGYVDLVSWIDGGIPFCSPSVSTVSRLNQTVQSQRPSEEHYIGAKAIVNGQLWGWPKRKWGEAGLKWNRSTTVFIAP